MENDGRSGDGDDLLEDTADTERDDGSSLKQSELGRSHHECKAPREDQNADSQQYSFSVDKSFQPVGNGQAFDRYRYYGQADEHDRCKEEDATKGIARRRVLE